MGKTMSGRLRRWILGCVGLMLPSLWLGSTVLLYELFPGFRGSVISFAISFTLAVLLTASAALTAPASWRLRLLWLAVVEFLVVGHVIVLLAWAYVSMGFGTPQPQVNVSAEWMKPLQFAWGSQSPGKPYSIASVSHVQRDGIDSVRFELREGEQYCDLFGKTSFRSEVNARDFPPVGTERWYSFSLLLPEDFPIENNRLVLAQWHGADKKYLGEPSRSPALAFRFSRGRFFITIRHSADRIVWNPSDACSMTLFDTERFPLGVWNDFVVQARWSYREDGQVNVWWNDQQVVNYSGPVGYNDDLGPYFKFGLYRDDSARTYIAYFNHVKMGTSREDVIFTTR